MIIGPTTELGQQRQQQYVGRVLIGHIVVSSDDWKTWNVILLAMEVSKTERTYLELTLLFTVSTILIKFGDIY